MSHFWAVIAEDDEPIRLPVRFAPRDRITTATRGPLRIHLYSTAETHCGPHHQSPRCTAFNAGETTVTLTDAGLSLDIPFAATTCLFARSEPGRVYLSSDPRLLARSTDELDQRAIYSVLQFGAIAPPFTIWRPVVQLTSGRVWTVSNSLKLRSAPRRPSSPDGAPDPQPWEARLTRLLDSTLRTLAPDERPVVCFSGGVDSGILAWRAARMGWHDTALVHLSRSRTDGETSHAGRIAAALGLPFVVVEDDETYPDRLLATIGTTWYQPFGDCSVVSTAVLAEAILDRFPDRQFVLDGVGADGGFGLAQKARQWQRICGLPAVLRTAAARAYGLGSVYRSAGRLEHVLRIARRAARMPYPLGAVAQNALDGIAYDFDHAVVEDVWKNLLEWNDGAELDGPEPAKLASLDIGLTCSRMFAQKTRALFDASIMEIGHPFLASEIVEFALRTMDSGAHGDAPKAALKRLLARELPDAQPHRAKSGFPLSVRAIFGSQSFLDVLTEIVSGRGPLADRLRPRVVGRLRDRLVARKPLNWQAYNFLWTAVFTHLWMQQVNCGGDCESDTAADRVGSTELACTR